MSCCAPISIPDKVLRARGYKSAELLVPCGHCRECARDRRNDWFVRLWSVYQCYCSLGFPVWFVTVTIDQKLWPDLKLTSPGVEDRITPFMRSWTERFRYLNGGKMPLRFLCSEFGKDGHEYIDKHGIRRVTTGALHFHGLLFGRLPIKKLQYGLSLTHGHVDFDLIRGPEAIRYTVKYATKDFSIENPRLRARVFCSPGIGNSTYYFGNSPATRVVLINGFHYRTPRYFIDKQWMHIYALSHCSSGQSYTEALHKARLAFCDPFGRSAVVNENALLREAKLRDSWNLVIPHDEPFRSLVIDRLTRDSRSPKPYSEVKRLFDFGIVGFGHPLIIYHDRLKCDCDFRSILSLDRSFLENEKKYKTLLAYEKHKTVIPLSLDISS